MNKLNGQEKQKQTHWEQADSSGLGVGDRGWEGTQQKRKRRENFMGMDNSVVIAGRVEVEEGI